MAKLCCKVQGSFFDVELTFLVAFLAIAAGRKLA